MQEPIFNIRESADQSLFFTLKYGSQYSVVGDRGNPVAQSDVTTLWFYAKKADGTSIMTHTDADATEIEWRDTVNGKITVHFRDSDTEGQSGDDCTYELKALLTNGMYITIESGKFNILPSMVLTP